jgi:hypothetical protein
MVVELIPRPGESPQPSTEAVNDSVVQTEAPTVTRAVDEATIRSYVDDTVTRYRSLLEEVGDD